MNSAISGSENLPPPTVSHWGGVAALSMCVALLIAEIEHRRWLDKLLAYLDDNSGSLLPPPGSPRDCRFGRWYYGPHSQRYRGLPAFVELESVHARLHRIGDELVSRRGAGQPGEPLRSELEDAVSAIAICLQRVQAEFAATQHSRR